MNGWIHKKCISLKELYEENGAELHYGGYIDFYSDEECEYYDLRTTSPDSSRSEILCCDGEECMVIFNDDDAILLSSITTGNKFYLTKEEYDIAVFE